jgi:hypothetical protein
MGVCAWNHFPSHIGRRCPHLDSFHCTSLLGRRQVKPYQDKGSTRVGLPFQHGCWPDNGPEVGIWEAKLIRRVIGPNSGRTA